MTEQVSQRFAYSGIGVMPGVINWQAFIRRLAF
jgi:hypothetical protein